MHLAHQEVADDDGRAHYENEADGVDDATQRCQSPEADHIPQDEEECLPCRGTEVIARKGNLDICVLVQELDALLEAPDATLDALQNVHHNPVLLCLSLLLEVLHQVPDELHGGDDEGTEDHGADMVAEDDLQRFGDQPELALLLILGEEPEAHSHGDEDLAQGNVEGMVPQVHEERYPEAPIERIAGLRTTPALRDAISPLAIGGAGLPNVARRPLVVAHARRTLHTGLPSDRAPEGAITAGTIGLGVGCVRRRRRVVRWHLRQQEGGRQEPKQGPDDGDDGLHDGDQNDVRVPGQEQGSDLVERDRKVDALHHADDHNEPNAPQGPNHKG
mmetsp:Transcript_74609/g.193987  ORF Transcript_74609/g.193987 Transcript_74609/m.193987 type:complete len:332 (+) Transcript_74609:352-1347(+)